MSGPRSLVRLALVAFAAVACLVAVACGDDDDSGSETASAKAKRYPPSVFSPEVFDGLSGSLTWYEASGGAVARGRESTIFKDFEELTGVSTRSEYNPDSTKFFAAMEAGQPQWNLIEFPAVGDWLKAKDEGYLEPLDPNVVPFHELQPGTYDKYGFHSNRYGVVLAWNTKAYPTSGTHPTSMTDLFDTERFPGKRCMFKYPEYGATLESALLADGVDRDALYPLDVDRALAKLDTIKDDIVWYTSGDQAVRLLIDGECDIGVVWTGRAYDVVTKNNAPIDFTWNDGMYLDAAYAIPKGARNIEAAQAQLAMWILDKKTQEEFLETVPYPTPTKEPVIPPGLEKWLPSGKNLATAIPSDDEYFSKHLDELNTKFTEWVGQ